MVVIILRANMYKDIQCPCENLEVAVLDSPTIIIVNTEGVILKFKSPG